MAFGAEFNNANGSIIASTEEIREIYQPVTSGNISSLSTTGSPAWEIDDHIFFRVASLSSGHYRSIFFDFDIYTGVVTIKSKTGTDTNAHRGDLATAYTAEGVHLKRNTQVGSTPGNYGLQVVGSAGSVVFDSRSILANDAIEITDTYAHNSRSGNPAAASSLLSSTYTDWAELSKNAAYDYIGIQSTTNNIGLCFSNNHTTYGTGIRFINWQDVNGTTFYVQNSAFLLVGEN